MALFDRFYLRPRKDAELRAVIDHLNHMLNTKKTFGAWLQDYGIGDFNEWKSRRKIVDTIMAEIAHNIRRYEPRVDIEEIKEVETDNPFRIRLEVRCRFLAAEKPVYIVIDSLANKVFLEGV
ncbi:MAG: hypothetical protein KatS3mg102_0123 [Planctomycetota bacterium]|nr:MAG: hypothetical protein KatS3mg102_0123 [Planctomycetota bacterium]